LRRLLEATRINVSRLLNRYTAAAASVLVIGLVWVLRSTAPIEVYQSQARQFDAQRAMQDIRILSSSQPQGDVMRGRAPANDEEETQMLASGQFNGREPGTPGGQLAAEYIAQRMQEIGLSPAGDDPTFIQTFVCRRYHFTDVPSLEMVSSPGVTQSLTYRQDFAEYVHLLPTFGDSQGMIVGMALGYRNGHYNNFRAYWEVLHICRNDIEEWKETIDT
jgi:hypothetical protein